MDELSNRTVWESTCITRCCLVCLPRQKKPADQSRVFDNGGHSGRMRTSVGGEVSFQVRHAVSQFNLIHPGVNSISSGFVCLNKRQVFPITPNVFNYKLAWLRKVFLLVNSGPIEIQNKRFGAQLFLLEMAALEIFETKGMFLHGFFIQPGYGHLRHVAYWRPCPGCFGRYQNNNHSQHGVSPLNARTNEGT